jgi:hypothetical protein
LSGARPRRWKSEFLSTYPVACVVLVTVETAEPLVSPGYWHVRDEPEMRAAWGRRRPLLDAAFERHLQSRAPWTKDTLE